MGESGMCCIRLYWGGRRKLDRAGFWNDIWIDDRLPVDSSGRPCYCKTRRGQLWGSLLEKAYSKQKGSYQAMIGGQMSSALCAMTGVECTEWKPKYTEDCWKE